MAKDAPRKRRATEEEKRNQGWVSLSISKTFPILLIWLMILPAVLVAQMYTKGVMDLTHIVYISDAATFSYMGLEYGNDFLKNKLLPQGIGSVPNINRFSALVYIWTMYAVASLVLHYKFKVENIPIPEIVLVAGILVVTYITGNKANKIAQTT